MIASTNLAATRTSGLSLAAATAAALLPVAAAGAGTPPGNNEFTRSARLARLRRRSGSDDSRSAMKKLSTLSNAATAKLRPSDQFWLRRWYQPSDRSPMCENQRAISASKPGQSASCPVSRPRSVRQVLAPPTADPPPAPGARSLTNAVGEA